LTLILRQKNVILDIINEKWVCKFWQRLRGLLFFEK
jgi:hypothetical protein